MWKRLVTTLVLPDGVLTCGYDGTLPVSETLAGVVSGSVTRTFNADLQLASENGIAFGYDTDGLLTSAGALTLTRSATNGLLTGTTLGSVTDAVTYNEFGEPATYSATANGAAVFSQQYTRDDAGRIATLTENVAGTPISYAYGYDTAGRLTSVSRDSVPMASYTYDANSNRLTRTTAAGTDSGTYDAEDRLTTYAGATYVYTPNGELATKTDASGATQYEYDAFGRLRKVTQPSGTVIEYVIDGQGRRVGKKVNGVLTKGWLYSGQLRIIAEQDGAGHTTAQFVYGTRTNVPDYVIRNGITYRVLSDHLGSPRVIVDASTGTVAEILGYSEFGEPLSAPSTIVPFAFAGGLYDTDTGLIHFGAREYDARAGRWTSKDPIGFGEDGTNLYQYGVNDPVDWEDPSGLSGVLTVYSSSNGGSSAPVWDAHAWVVYTPDGGVSTSYGTYGPMVAAPRGLNQNWELDHWSDYGKRTGDYDVVSRTRWIDDAHEKALMDVIARYRRAGEGAWSPENACSGFARDAWFAATGEHLTDRLRTDMYGNPKTLGQSLRHLNGGLGARVVSRSSP